MPRGVYDRSKTKGQQAAPTAAAPPAAKPEKHKKQSAKSTAPDAPPKVVVAKDLDTEVRAEKNQGVFTRSASSDLLTLTRGNLQLLAAIRQNVTANVLLTGEIDKEITLCVGTLARLRELSTPEGWGAQSTEETPKAKRDEKAAQPAAIPLPPATPAAPPSGLQIVSAPPGTGLVVGAPTSGLQISSQPPGSGLVSAVQPLSVSQQASVPLPAFGAPPPPPPR